MAQDACYTQPPPSAEEVEEQDTNVRPGAWLG